MLALLFSVHRSVSSGFSRLGVSISFSETDWKSAFNEVVLGSDDQEGETYMDKLRRGKTPKSHPLIATR